MSRGPQAGLAGLGDAPKGLTGLGDGKEVFKIWF